jgi:hypothetical protein
MKTALIIGGAVLGAVALFTVGWKVGAVKAAAKSEG